MNIFPHLHTHLHTKLYIHLNEYHTTFQNHIAYKINQLMFKMYDFYSPSLFTKKNILCTFKIKYLPNHLSDSFFFHTLALNRRSCQSFPQLKTTIPFGQFVLFASMVSKVLTFHPLSMYLSSSGVGGGIFQSHPFHAPEKKPMKCELCFTRTQI